MRTAETIEAGKSQNTRRISSKARPGAGKRIKPWQWQPGQSGNPGGRPKNDMAAEIARAVFNQNPDAIYKAMSKALLKGNAYTFKELAERGFGRMKETIEHGASEDLLKRLTAGRDRARG